MNIAEFKNPISGDKGNFLSLKDWKENILGVGFVVLVVVLGQKFVSWFAGMVPGGIVSDKIQNPLQQPAGTSYHAGMYGVN